MAELNAQQRKAIEHNEGSILVIAGAGTGKTRVITERIARILSEKRCRNDQVLALTFTEKAAAEMEERLDRLMPLGYEAVPVMTFHAFCDKLLRQFGVDIGLSPGFKVLSGVDHWVFMRDRLFDFELDYFRPLGNPTAFIEAMLRHFESVKEELVSPESYLEFAEKRAKEAKDDAAVMEAKKTLELARAYGKYQALMEEAGFLDFPDQQYKTIELLRRRPNILKHLQEHYRYLLVDEYQDTNIAQNEITDLLAAGHKNLMVVGDDDQSIYKFRGAAISNILQFEAKYPGLKKVVLTQNYRSSQAILDFAYASIRHNDPDRLEVKSSVQKKLTSPRPGDETSVCITHCTTLDQEVETVTEEVVKLLGAGTPPSEIAVLSRKNQLLSSFTAEFKRRNIPYEFPSERGLYERPEIRELIALLRVLSNPADDVSLFAVLRMDLWKIPMETIANLLRQAKSAYQPVWFAAQKEKTCELLVGTVKDLLEFSKNHTAGETLYRFTDSMKIYEKLLQQATLEAEETILSIAAFFGKIRTFERTAEQQNSVTDFVAYLDLAEEAGENPAATVDVGGREAVHVSSVHAAKGLEFHTVFVVGMTQRRFPSDDRKDAIPVPDALVHEILTEGDSHLQEERRLFYVACTRAKEKLHLLYSDFYNPTSAKNPRASKRSHFLDEVKEQVKVMELEKTAEGMGRFLRPEAKAPVSAEISGMREPMKSFSYSQLTSFERCPRQYEYSFILRIPTPPEGVFSFGNTMHNTLLEFYRLVQQSKQATLFTEYTEDLSLERLLQIYEDKWLPYGYESRAHMEARKARGREILMTFYDKFKHDIPRVEFLEKAFKLKIGDVTVTGRIDRADKRSDGTLEIIDYKTGKAKDQKKVDEDLQLAIYALATSQCFNLPASKLTLYFLDEDQKVTTEPTEERLEKAKEKITALAAAINSSDFAPTPGKQVCSYCPYSKICDAAMV